MFAIKRHIVPLLLLPLLAAAPRRVPSMSEPATRTFGRFLANTSTLFEVIRETKGSVQRTSRDYVNLEDSYTEAARAMNRFYSSLRGDIVGNLAPTQDTVTWAICACKLRDVLVKEVLPASTDEPDSSTAVTCDLVPLAYTLARPTQTEAVQRRHCVFVDKLVWSRWDDLK